MFGISWIPFVACLIIALAITNIVFFWMETEKDKYQKFCEKNGLSYVEFSEGSTPKIMCCPLGKPVSECRYYEYP